MTENGEPNEPNNEYRPISDEWEREEDATPIPSDQIDTPPTGLPIPDVPPIDPDDIKIGDEIERDTPSATPIPPIDPVQETPASLPEQVQEWIDENDQSITPEQPTLTVTLDDLFEPDDPAASSTPPLPPRPIMTDQSLSDSADEQPTADLDDEATPSLPMEPIKPQEQSTTPKRDLPPAPPPIFTPAPTQRDDQATVVNPRSAFAGEGDTERAREVEEIRRKRREQRELRRQGEGETQVTVEREFTVEPTRVGRRQVDAPEVSQPTIVAPPVREQALPKRAERVVIPAQPAKQKRRRSPFGCLLRTLLTSFFLLLFAIALGIFGLFVGYIVIANDLPSVTEIESKTSQFETIFIYDADGNELYSVASPTAGNRTYVRFDQIDQDLINATIATEDSRFYENFGFDPIAIARAVSEVILSGAFTRGDLTAAGGASTITQQLVRATLLDSDERGQTTVRRKIREIILAAELNRTLTRELGEIEGRNKILELYLNEIYYGNRAYGIEAAAQTYFKKSASDLTLAEASLLAGLPQAPALWDPVTAPEFAEGRQKEVLELTTANGYITREQAQTALNERLAYTIEAPVANIRYPHFTLGVLQQLENTFGSDVIYNSGFRVYTTLRPSVQQLAEQVLAEQRGNIDLWGANNASMVVLDPVSAEIQALVGSLDYRNEAISGQVNMARAPRQPGSTIKPFVYLAAMERGMTPATLFWDVPSAFPDGTNPPYEPKNYDNQFHGPMLLRKALANSYNIPAVKALEFVGVCNFVVRAQLWGLGLEDLGCNEVNAPRNFGLALALGGGEISPLQMASAYAMVANGGQQVEPISIRQILNKNNEVVFTTQGGDTSEVEITVGGVTSDLAFLLTHILSDNGARFDEFGADNLLSIPGFKVAAKTGTSGTNEFDVRDAWTIGYAPNLVTAVWVGNTDNKPLAEGASGYRVASPIWNAFMTRYLPTLPALDFVPPTTVTTFEVCADSGVQPNPNCATRTTEVFSKGQPPLSAENHFLRTVNIDPWTLQIANDLCNESGLIQLSNFDLLVSGSNPEVQSRYRQEVVDWLQGNGRWWADRYGVKLPLGGQTAQTNQACQPGVQRPASLIQQPVSGETVQPPFVQIGGIATAPNFAGYQLEYGFGENPTQWFPIGEFSPQPQPGGLLGILDTNQLDAGGLITLRLTVFGADNPYTSDFVDRARKENRVTINLLLPTPTPEPTDVPTAVPSPTPTNIPLPTDTPITDEPTAVPTVEPTPIVAVETPTPLPTEAPVNTPGPTATSDLVAPATREPTPEP